MMNLISEKDLRTGGQEDRKAIEGTVNIEVQRHVMALLRETRTLWQHDAQVRTGCCKRRNVTVDDFIGGRREPVRRSVIAIRRCILYARSLINSSNHETRGSPYFPQLRDLSLSLFLLAKLSLPPAIFITRRDAMYNRDSRNDALNKNLVFRYD